jgi:pyruvate-formate lyase
VNLTHQIFVRHQEASKVHGVRVPDHRHQEIARAIGTLHVDGETEAHVFVVSYARRSFLVNGLDE